MKPRSLTPLCSIRRSSSRSTACANVACDRVKARWCTQPGSLGVRPESASPSSFVKTVIRRPAPGPKYKWLADQLDPDGRLHVVAPRAPLSLGGAGYHWYVVPRVGYPDPETFAAAYRLLAELHDELRERLGLSPAQTVLGGFSMGSVMSYAL